MVTLIKAREWACHQCNMAGFSMAQILSISTTNVAWALSPPLPCQIDYNKFMSVYVIFPILNWPSNVMRCKVWEMNLMCHNLTQSTANFAFGHSQIRIRVLLCNRSQISDLRFRLIPSIMHIRITFHSTAYWAPKGPLRIVEVSVSGWQACWGGGWVEDWEIWLKMAIVWSEMVKAWPEMGVVKASQDSVAVLLCRKQKRWGRVRMLEGGVGWRNWVLWEMTGCEFPCYMLIKLWP